VIPGPRRAAQRRRETLPVLIGVVLWLRVAGAADTKIPAHVEIGVCAAAPADEVMALVRVELGSQLVDAPPAGGCRVVVECWGDEVTVSVSAPDRLARSHRTDLTGSPLSVRPRIVALEIAELVRDVAREPELLVGASIARGRATPATEPPPSDRARPTPAVRHDPSRFDLGAFALGSTFRYDGRWFWGGGLRIDYSLDWMIVGVDATVVAREQASDLGSTDAVLTRTSPYVAWRVASHRAAFRLGAGHAFGWAKIAGRAAAPTATDATVTGAWTGPYALFGFAYAATDTLAVDLRAETGWVTLPVVGQVARGDDVAIQGAWTSLFAGLSLAL
jgi:hypothetical protein